MFLNEKNLGLSAKFSSENCFFPFEKYFVWETNWPISKTGTDQRAVSRAQSAASFQALSYWFQSLPDFGDFLREWCSEKVRAASRQESCSIQYKKS